MSAAETMEAPAEDTAADDRNGEVALLAAAGHVARRCLICNDPAMIEPQLGLLYPADRDSERAAIWECPNCYAVRRMRWPFKDRVVTR